VDVSTGKPTITEAQRQAYRPASFGSVPSRTTNPNLVLSNCASFNSRGYAVHADLATNIQITDLVVVDPVGISGKALCLGCTHNQFATSTVSFKCWGDTVDTFLAINNSDTATFSGFVVTNKPAPIKVTGSGTKNLKIQNVTVYSSSALQGTNGVVVSSEVPGSQVALSNIAKGNVTSAPAKPVATVPGDDETSQLVIVSAVKIEPVQPKVGDVVKVDVTFTNVSGTPGQIVVTSDRPCQIPMPDGSVRYDRATFDVSAMSPGESATWRFWFVPLQTGRFNVCFKSG
jgi:hypothetical protein